MVFVAPLQFVRYAAKMKPFEFSQVNFATSDIWLLAICDIAGYHPSHATSYGS